MLNKTIVDLILTSEFNDLDEMLDALGLTHKELRQYCHQHKLAQPPLTEGLRWEIGSTKRADAIKEYYLSHLEYNTLFYRGTDHLTKHQLAERLRQQCMSEHEIYCVTGSTAHYNTQRLSAELQHARDNGAKVLDLAEQYGISHSKVSQLTRSTKQYRKLTPQEKAEIRASQQSVSNLANLYGTTINTIYVIKREV